MPTPSINGVTPTTEQLATLHTAASMKAGLDASPAVDRAAFQSAVSGYIGADRVLAVGDSITNDGWLTTTPGQTLYPGGTYTGGGVTAVRTEDMGYVAWASAFSGVEIINKGISGNTIQQVIDRLATDVGPYKPAVIIDNSATNSLFGVAADAMTEDDLFAFLVAQKTTCLNYYKQVPAKVLLTECLPRSTFDARKNRVAARYNQWLRTLPELHSWIRVASVAGLFSDPAVYGGATPAPRWTRDGTHPHNLGGWRYGRKVADCLAGWVKPDNGFRPSVMDFRGGFGSPAVCRNTNPYMGFTAGVLGAGATGVVASEYTVNRLVGSPNIACSIETDADGFQRQKLVIDFLAAGDAVWFGISPASGLWDASRAGLLSCAADVGISAGSAEVVNSLLMFTTANVGGTAYSSTALNQNTQSIASRVNLPISRGAELRLRSPRILVPVGACSSWQTQLRLFASAAGQVTISVGAFMKLQETAPA